MLTSEVIAGTITFELRDHLADGCIDVTEADIALDVPATPHDHRQLVDGAAGVAITTAQQFGRQHPWSDHRRRQLRRERDVADAAPHHHHRQQQELP